ncbi:MAG: hypothetical protein JO113_02080 [Candidatus Eremiobacteraeota bacterium]|nr:hypothetical protein [Candidatus Eremiobacteraeota bacterium]
MLISTVFFIAQSFFGTLPIDDIRCDPGEGAVEHIHVNLQLFDRGRAIVVPAGIGIPQGSQCLYWIHTHSNDGFIHIESPVKRTFDLGEFFDVWGPNLSWTQAASLSSPHGRRLAIWVDGKPWHGRDPRSIVLADHETIVIQNGPPFAKSARADWSKL